MPRSKGRIWPTIMLLLYLMALAALAWLMYPAVAKSDSICKTVCHTNANGKLVCRTTCQDL